jgi:hypothetical protein
MGERSGDENAPRPCCRSRFATLRVVKVFDILYLNDKVLTNKRLSERKRVLKSGRIFKDLDEYKGRLEFAEEGRGKSGKDIRAMLESILESKWPPRKALMRGERVLWSRRSMPCIKPIREAQIGSRSSQNTQIKWER